MGDFIHFLQGTMIEPEVISWYHFFVLIPIIAAAILIPLFFKNAEEKVYKRILFIFWFILIVLEIFKQLIKAYHYDESSSYWEYSYRDFPFQMCSMIYYFIPIILFFNKEKHPKIVDAAIGYMSFICLMTGAVVCVYTKMATSSLIYINIQTFIHHGSLIVLGVFIFVWNRKSITIKTFYRSLIAFAITVVIAILINLAFYPHFINMFFINPTIITNIPIGNVVQEKAGYPVFLIGFLSLIVLMIFLTYLVETSIYKAASKRKL